LGLEPIAAHSQFGEQVSGHEEVPGEGSAADAVEGLVSASLAHEISPQAQPEEQAGSGWESQPADPGWEPQPAAEAAASGWSGPGTPEVWDQTQQTSRVDAGGWDAPAEAPRE